MKATCTKRLARAADFESVHRICMHPAVIPFLGFEPMPASEFESIFAALLGSERFFIFECAASIGGFAHVSRHAGRSQHTAFISTLAVDPDLHASGFAQSMLQTVLSDLRSESVRRVELVVETDNVRAIRFYKRNGFSVEGTLRGSYRRAHEDCDIDSHIMAIVYPPAVVAKPSANSARVLLVR